MKILKKIATLLLALCLTVPCFATMTYAAGSIQFTDPSTKTGETVEVTCAIKGGEEIEDATVVMTYDTNMLKFKSGDNVSETSAGQLTYSVKAAGNDTIRFKMNFDVLKEGTTKIEVASGDQTKVYNTSDDKLELQKGFSTITIAAGEAPAVTETPGTTTDTDKKVTVNEVEYTLSGEFAKADIPEGFTETTMELDGEQVKVVQQEESGICLGYLIDANGVGEFYLYDSEDASFYPFEQLTISESTVITVLTNKTELKLPKEYQKVTLTLNGEDFTVWQNSEKEGFYVLYAINNQGEKSLYQLDSVEGTYQRFEAPTVEEEKKATSMFGKLTELLQKHLDYVILVTGLGFIFFVVLVITLGVKLHNRNAELDELYDEYDIDVEEDEPVVKEKKGFFKKKDEEDDFEEEDFEEENFETEEEFSEEENVDDEDFEEENFDEEDDFDDEEILDDEDDFDGEDDFEDFDEDDDFIDTDFDDDDFEDAPVRFARTEEVSSSYEDFDMDFIDLDD